MTEQTTAQGDQAIEYARERQFRSDRALGEQFLEEERARKIDPQRIADWKASMPANLPSDDEYDYAAMFADGNVPQKTTDGTPSYLPEQYYKGGTVRGNRGAARNYWRTLQDINTGMTMLSPDMRVAERGTQLFFDSLLGGLYNAGVLTAFPVDIAAETVAEAAREASAEPMEPGDYYNHYYKTHTPIQLISQETESLYTDGGEEAVREFHKTPYEKARDTMFQRWDLERPSVGETETFSAGEEIMASMLAIAGDFVLGAKMANMPDVAVDAGKLKKFTHSLIDNIKTGMYGEYLFSSIDEEGGNFSTMLAAMGVPEEITGLLDTRGMEEGWKRIVLNTVEGAVLGGLWQFGKIAKDTELMNALASRAPIIAERLGKALAGGPTPGTPMAQRGAVGDLTPSPEIEARVSQYLTPEEQQLMTPRDRGSIESILQTTASPQEVAAMAGAGGAKRGWYTASMNAMRHIFGEDADRFAALLAATSPQTSVESNLRNALNVWKNWTAAGRPTDADSITRIMGESVEGTKGEESVLGAWEKNTQRALAGEDPMAGLSGPKVDSFMRNLAGFMQEVTQDTWMARALGMSQARHFAGRTLTGVEDELGQMGVKASGYLAGNMLVREAADIMSRTTGEAWTPAEVQETVWSWAKALYEAGGAAGETRRLPEILRAEGVSDDTIRNVPDFSTLFGQKGEFRDILEEAGYGEQIATLPAGGFGQRTAVSAGPESGRDLAASARRLHRTSRQRGTGTGEDIYQWIRRNVVRRAGDQGTVSRTFGRRSRRAGSNQLADEPVTHYSLPKQKQVELNQLGVSTPPLNEFSNPQKFHDFVAAARDDSPRAASYLHLYSPEEYADMRTFVTSDGTAGFAIAADGDIVSVFNKRSGRHSGVAPHLLALAIEQGGTKLDAFDSPLIDIYGDIGFVETSRDAWNPKYKPEGWDEEKLGTPDVIFMELE